MRALAVTVLSFALTAGVLTNAYIQKKQFYPSVVYITKSSPSLAVLYIQAFVMVILMGKLIRKVFFGQLRAAEMEHLIERSWYAVTETCLAFTVFRDDFSPRFVALFTLLLFLKCFHWLAEDRVDYMERSPVISWTFHLRVLSLLALLGSLDGYFISHACYSTLIKGPSVQLVFGFEYAILLTMAIHIFVKYCLHTIDLQSENPWENKAVYLLYAELILGFAKVILYMLFLAIMIKVHTFPLFAIRPMYLTMRAFKKAASDVIMSRRAIRNMNTLYPDATAEDLSSGDNVCIICREEMAEGCKKLPCSHIFHTSCLRSWFQRQQTCPTCRMDVLRNTPTNNRQQQRQQQQPQQQQQQPPVVNGFAGFPNMPMWPPMAQPQQGAQAPPSGASSANTSGAQTTTTSSGAQNTMPTGGTTPAGFPFFMPPPPPMFMPFNVAAPTPPVDLSGLSTEELSAMEGQERQNIENRIQCLKNIQTLLDSAVLQMQQYTQVVTSLQQNAKTSSSEEKPGSSRGESSQPQNNTPEDGAVGGESPKEETIPGWVNPRTEEEEAAEVRRRRLEKFKNTDVHEQ